MTSYLISLPGYSKPPLSLNDRMHWATRSRHAAALKQAAWAGAKAEHIPHLEAAVITLHYLPRDERRRDADNLFATLKPCVDGIRDAGVVSEDTHDVVTPRVQIHAPLKGQPGRLWLTVEEVAS